MTDAVRNAWQVTKTLFVRLRFIFIFVLIGLIVGNWEFILAVADRITRPGKASDEVTGEYEWFCPMHPSVVRKDDKEKCPICGMPLSRRRKGEVTQLPPGILARLQLSPFRIRQAGVATEEIGYRNLTREIRTLGTLEWDERKISHPSVRIAGRVDELYVNFTGQRLKKGDPLYKLYSPDLVTTQEEYLLALKTLEEVKAGAPDDDPAAVRARRLAESARERMKLWGIADETLAELEKSRKAQTHLVIPSPIGGVVIKKDIDIGRYVAAGGDPWTVADDSLLWLQARVFERDLGLVKEGQVVEVTTEAYPGKTFTGKVAFIAPELQADTRTAKVRVEIPNAQAQLKAGMYATAVLRVPLGKSGEIFYGCCDNCPDVREDAAGKCRKCAMELVKKGGVREQEKKETHDHKGHEPKQDEKPRKIYVCDLHAEEVSDKPGQCMKEGCAGMVLEERRLAPGSKVVYVCPQHPEVVSDKPGTCPKDGKKLRYRVVSDKSRVAETWVCPMHPGRTAGGKLQCPDCGTAMKHVESEELLAVPFSAVIDTGTRKVVFLEKGHGTLDAVEIEVGPRAGEYYPVLKGLAAGDRVVTNGAFLLDAETRLNPAAGAAYFGAGTGGGHEGHK